MKTVIHRAKGRGHINRGWVDTWHTFSYGEYFNAERVHFGALRILNDDTIAPGEQGFGPHERNNMETVSIVLSGNLEHKDGLGNKQTLRKGRIQVMSTGTGVIHSEYNKSPDKPVNFLQIWIVPNRNEVDPRYQSVKIDELLNDNELIEIVKPWPGDGKGAWIYQQAWLSMGRLGKGHEVTYTLKSPGSYGVYLFVIDGEVLFEDDLELFARDGLAIREAASIRLKAAADTEVLLIEIPPLK